MDVTNKIWNYNQWIFFRSNDLEKAVKVFHEDTKDTFYSTYAEIMTAYAKQVVKNIS